MAMDYKPYKKAFEYSYTLGAFPTIELIKTKPQLVECVIIHSTFTGESEVRKLCRENGIRTVTGDRMIERLSDKENVFVIGVFKKYEEELAKDESHVLLVNPSNMGNLGTIIRTCAGFGITDLALISPCADIFNPKTVRSSMGALFRIRHRHFASFEEYRAAVSDRECFSFMLTDRAKSLPGVEKPSVFTLIFGNEATGLPDEYGEKTTPVIIPQSELVDSLNLTIAAGIGMYEFTEAAKRAVI